jgi:hypothetical protein
MAKIIFFLFILFVIVFPIFISNKSYKNISQTNEKKPVIEIFNGVYKKYNTNLEMNGSFDKAEVFNINYEKIYNLIADDLRKKEKYFAKVAIKENNIIKATDAKYKNDDYFVKAKKVIYYEKKKFLKGWNFNFKSDKAKGKGEYCEVDKNKNLFAKNIIYYIKVEK